MVSCMNWSVFKSTNAVASSMTRILLFFNIALARQINCFCPTDNAAEFEASSVSKPCEEFSK